MAIEVFNILFFVEFEGLNHACVSNRITFFFGLNVLIKVMNINEPPVIADFVANIMEDADNSGPSAFVTYMKVEDPDGDLASTGIFTITQILDEFENDKPTLFAINRISNH